MPDGQNIAPPRPRKHGISTLPQPTTPTGKPHMPSAPPVQAPARKPGKRKGAPAVPLPPAVIRQHGLEHRLAQGSVYVERGAGDPDNPARTIDRPRAVCAYERLAAVRAITAAHRLACDRYLGLCEAQAGGRWQSGERVGAPSDVRPWERQGATAAQLAAVVSLRAVHDVLGASARGIVAMLVVGNMPVPQIAARLRRTPQQAAGEVVAALTRMVEWWGIE